MKTNKKTEIVQDESSSDEAIEEDESTLSYSSWTRSNNNYSAAQDNNYSAMQDNNYSAVSRSQTASGNLNALIKPKERIGQSMQAKTINKNSLMEIGTKSDELKSEAKEAFQLSRSDTMKGY